MDEQIWEGIVETDRGIRYYGKLSGKHRARHQWLSGILAVFATGAAVPLITQLPDWLSAILFLGVAGGTIASLMLNYSSKATAAHLFSEQFQHLGVEWRQLWYGQPTQAQIDALWEKFYRIPSGFELGVDRKLNAKAQHEGNQVLPGEFAYRQDINDAGSGARA